MLRELARTRGLSYLGSHNGRIFRTRQDLSVQPKPSIVKNGCGRRSFITSSAIKRSSDGVGKDEKDGGKVSSRHERIMGKYPYLAKTLARYPKRDGPWLIGSFLVLHELTAIIPLIALFLLLNWIGAGQGILDYLNTQLRKEDEGGQDAEEETKNDNSVSNPVSFWKSKLFEWVRQGSVRVNKIGNRYGYLEDNNNDDGNKSCLGDGDAEQTLDSLALDNDKNSILLANGLAAFLIVKALLPFRIGFSIYFAPTLVKGVRSLGRIFGKKNNTSR